MKRLRKFLVVAIALILVAGVAGYWWQRPMVLTGTGYAAHNACAVELVAGRDNAAEDLPPNPLVPVLRSATKNERTTASILGLLGKQHAVFTEGFGCAVTADPPKLPPPTPVTATGNPFTDAPVPQASAAVEAALDTALGTELNATDRAELGTRAVVVFKDGEIVAERYADGFGKDTPQLGWSMSKSVTNLIVGRLVAQGVVSLDDAQLRPEWTDDRSKITIRQLLNMTSGLEWDETYALNTAITRMLFMEPDMGSFVASFKSAHKPGTYLQYSSGSTTLLCSILAEKAGGANLPRDQIFAPLGLSSAVMETDGSGTPVCSSYMWATPRDWAAVGQFALQGGTWNGEQLLPANWMAESTQAVDVESHEDSPYASAWWPNEGPGGALEYADLPADAYFAQGHDGQRILVVPSEQLVVVRMGFSPGVDDIRTTKLTADLISALG
ncbi:MAG: class C beta-lactamase-related serine hydrolase [Aeromicrobium sp.]|nr:MAG: class C beta-lactamase-related serine hydrolase [Aeromicrobium sp.]